VVTLLVLAFAAAFALSLVLTPVAGILARRFGFIDRPGGRKLQAEPVPRLGGLAIFVSLAATAAGLVVWLRLCSAPGGSDIAKAAGFLAEPGAPLRFGAIAAGAVAVFVLGLLDDRWDLPAWVKLAVEVLVAVGVVAAGVRVTALVEWWWVGAVISVLWIVGITNAFNLLDNMDGLSAGVASMAAFGFFVVTVQTDPEQWLLGLLFVSIAGAAGGFLMHNLHPARIYMGDCGSLLLGFLLAVLAVEGSYYTYADDSIVPLATPLLILAIPLFDTASVFFIRWREGRPFFVGDTSHFSHRLVAMGMSVRSAVGTIYLITLAMGLGAAMLLAPQGARGILTLVQAVVMLTIVALLETAGRRKA
jgi:UDP-GlcNAc:undecaprenyl-phosphate GlcNAc-1-phosphate transferase